MIRMPVFRTSRKVQSFGSSLALTLPSMFIKACEIDKGSQLNVLYDLKGVLLTFNCNDPDVVIKSVKEIIKKINEKEVT